MSRVWRLVVRDGDAAAPDRQWRQRALVGLVWLALVLFLVGRHVMWRDEVRAFSLALQGATVFDMPVAARGYGHPLLWHVILRLAHDAFGSPLVLPGAALVIGVVTAGLLLGASRLSLLVVTLTLFSGFGAYNYVVMARNYGLSMVLMFLFAALYARDRQRGLILGLILALLCNTNVHAVIIAGALTLFWWTDLMLGDPPSAGQRRGPMIVGAAALVLGAAISVLSVFPSVEDAPSAAAAASLSTRLVDLLPGMAFGRAFGNFNVSAPVRLLAAVLVIGSVAMFVRRPAALVAAVVAAAGFQLLFVFVYPGHYRHVALLIVLDVTLLWLVADGHGGRWRPRLAPLQTAGTCAFLLLLLAQTPATARTLFSAIRERPESEVRNVARLLHARGLDDSILIVEPDFMGEALPYYAPNPIYSLRKAAFAPVVGLRLAESAPMTLERILGAAQELHRSRGRRVVILLNERVGREPKVVERSNFGPFVITRAGVQAFRRATTPLAQLRGASGDETFDVVLYTGESDKRR